MDEVLFYALIAFVLYVMFAAWSVHAANRRGKSANQ